MNYYNDYDKGAAAWLRELIKAGLIPNGYVDERSITEVTPSDLEGFTQCHFFAGIGGWSLALKLAGVPSSTRLWTGSPPCQPFSVAGQSLGFDDPRHLAPTLLRLIRECRPTVIFGEQVAAAIGKNWLDFVFLNLEDKGYACGQAVLPAASVGAPHKRDRLFFGAVGNAFGKRLDGFNALLREEERQRGEGGVSEAAGACEISRMADTDDTRPQGRCGVPECSHQQSAGAAGMVNGVGNTNGGTQFGFCAEHERALRIGLSGEQSNKSDRPTNPHNSFWSDADWLGCRDGKFRPVEARAQQMVDGFSGGMGHSSDPSMRKAIEEIGFPIGKNIPARVSRLRGYGNAIVPQCAAEFIKAFAGACSDES